MSQTYNLISEKEKNILDQKLYLESHPNLDKTLEEPRFTIAELGIKARDATYWDKQGILPDLKGKGIRKYDLIQSVWIKLITQMRSLGVGTELIKKFKEELFRKISAIDFLKNEQARKEIQKVLDDTGHKVDLNKIFESGEFTEQETTFNMFKLLVTASILFKRDIELLVFETGEFVPYDLNYHNAMLQADTNYAKLLSTPHIAVSMTKAYVDLVNQWQPLPFFNEISILSKEEILILESLKQDNVKSVTIKFTNNGKMDRIEIEEDKEIDIASRVGENLSRYGFEDLELKAGDGTILHCIKRKKIKF